eukprot:scaffold13895_cov68-Phaeocystis_antarctica.AAC.5
MTRHQWTACDTHGDRDLSLGRPARQLVHNLKAAGLARHIARRCGAAHRQWASIGRRESVDAAQARAMHVQPAQQKGKQTKCHNAALAR